MLIVVVFLVCDQIKLMVADQCECPQRSCILRKLERIASYAGESLIKCDIAQLL